MIVLFASGPIATNAMVVHCEETKCAVVVDPASGSLELIQDYVEEKGLKVEKILITHSHWDHIVDCKIVKEFFEAPVYCHHLDAANLENPGCDGLPCALEIEGVKPDVFLEEGDEIDVGKLRLKVLHTPGHSPGSICFYIADLKALIGGDLVFRGGVGTMALPTAEPEKMAASLAKIAALPQETTIYPGHWETTTVKEEIEQWEFNLGEQEVSPLDHS